MGKDKYDIEVCIHTRVREELERLESGETLSSTGSAGSRPQAPYGEWVANPRTGRWIW